MKFNFGKWAKTKIANFNFFELGNSAILLNLLMFYPVPLLSLLGFSFGFTLANNQTPWRALSYAALGIAALAIGYFNPLAGHSAKKTPNIFAGDWNPKRTKIAFGTIFLIGTTAKIIRLLAGGYFIKSNLNPLFGRNIFYSLIGYLDGFCYIALAIGLINYYRLKKTGNENYRLWKLLAFGVLFSEIAYGIPSCSRTMIITPILIYFLIKSYLSKIKYREIILTSTAIIFVLFPFGSICRHPFLNALKAYRIIDMPIGNNQKLTDWNGINISNAVNFSIDSFTGRINQSFVFSKILDAPPELLAPYGSSFSNFLLTLGPPRFIWKNKPLSTNNLGNSFGRQLGVASPDDFATSIGPTVMGDLYINFGVWGIIFGMLLMGLVFRFICDYLVKFTGISSSGLMIYSVFWLQIILGMENEIAPVWAGLIKLSALLVVIHFFLVSKSKKRK